MIWVLTVLTILSSINLLIGVTLLRWVSEIGTEHSQHWLVTIKMYELVAYRIAPRLEGKTR